MPLPPVFQIYRHEFNAQHIKGLYTLKCNNLSWKCETHSPTNDKYFDQLSPRDSSGSHVAVIVETSRLSCVSHDLDKLLIDTEGKWCCFVW